MKAAFAVSAAVACAAATVAALVVAVHKAGRTAINQAYETKFRALKWGRVGTYAVLAGCQVGHDDEQQRQRCCMHSSTRYACDTVVLFFCVPQYIPMCCLLWSCPVDAGSTRAGTP